MLKRLEPRVRWGIVTAALAACSVVAYRLYGEFEDAWEWSFWLALAAGLALCIFVSPGVRDALEFGLPRAIRRMAAQAQRVHGRMRAVRRLLALRTLSLCRTSCVGASAPRFVSPAQTALMHLDRWLERRPRLGRLLPFVPYLVILRAVFHVTVDDCYITFRYAANLLHGNGAVFNSGERVEGFTSILHLLLCALLSVVFPSLDLLLKAKIASAIFGLAMVALTGRLARAAGLAGCAAIAAQTLVATNTCFAISSVNALETTLYGSLLMLAVLRTIADSRSPGHGPPYAIGALFFLATLARPECAIIYGSVLAMRTFFALRTGSASLRREMAGNLSYVAPFALLLLGQWSYYGSVLPNTYYAKHLDPPAAIRAGGVYLWRGDLRFIVSPSFLAEMDRAVGRLSLLPSAHAATLVVIASHIVFWGLACAGLLLWRGHGHARRVFAAVLLGELVFLYRSGGDWMPGWRFCVPVLPILAVLQCGLLDPRTMAGTVPVPEPSGASSYSERIGVRAGYEVPASAASASSVACAICLAILFALTGLTWRQLRCGLLSRVQFSENGSPPTFTGELGERWALMAQYVRDRLPAGCGVATSEVGFLGYINLDKRIIDLRGLTDREIADAPEADKHLVGVVDFGWQEGSDPIYRILKRRRPEYILTFDYSGRAARSVLGCYALVGEISPKSETLRRPPTAVYRLVR